MTSLYLTNLNSSTIQRMNKAVLHQLLCQLDWAVHLVVNHARQLPVHLVLEFSLIFNSISLSRKSATYLKPQQNPQTELSNLSSFFFLDTRFLYGALHVEDPPVLHVLLLLLTGGVNLLGLWRRRSFYGWCWSGHSKSC